MNTNIVAANLPQSQHTRNAWLNPVAQVFYHNFVVNKKNVDGKFLLENFKVQSTGNNSSKFQNQRLKYHLNRRQKHGSFTSALSEQKPSKTRSGSSEGNRQKQEPLEFKVAFKHIKTSQDSFLFKKSIDLRDRYLFLENPQNLQKLLKQRKLQSRRGMIELSLDKQEWLSKQKQLTQNSRQCKVQRCNLLAKILNDPSNLRKKTQSVQKKSKSMGKKVQPKKIFKKKTLEEFIPKLNIDELKETSDMIDFRECSAKNYAVILNDVIVGLKNGSEKRQIASLTKIMTCITALFLTQKFEINLENSQTKVSREATALCGTTANLKFRDIVTLKDLLYGMMLPSGNDAAFTIAEYFGRLLYRQSSDYSQKVQEVIKIEVQIRTNDMSGATNVTEKKMSAEKQINMLPSFQAVQYFIQEMNTIAKHLKMNKTNFSNCHGLSDCKNKSTAYDLVKLSLHCVKLNSRFREIVSTTSYEAKIFNKNSKMIRVERWTNSNLGLYEHEGLCYGIKTGITPTAGPCLASHFKSQNGEQVTIILLNCQSKEDRFKQASYIFQTLKKSNVLSGLKIHLKSQSSSRHRYRSKTNLSNFQVESTQFEGFL